MNSIIAFLVLMGIIVIPFILIYKFFGKSEFIKKIADKFF